MTATRTRRAPATPDEIRAMIRMRLEHHSWPEIAARFGYAASGASARAAAMKFAPAAGDERLLDAMRGIRGYPPRGSMTVSGYWRVYRPEHPLAEVGGYVREHRMVLYDLIGAGPHPCARCGRVLTWPEVAVDHINCDRLDNRPENLQVCCGSCNQTLRWARWRARRDYPEWMDDPECPPDFEGWEVAA